MKASLLILITVLLLLGPGVHAGKAEEASTTTDQQSTAEDSHSRTIIYPILIQAPIYGAGVDAPSVPGGGGGGGGIGDEISADTDSSLDSAYGAGFSVERGRWFVDFSGMYAKASANADTPRIVVDGHVYYVVLTGGWKLYKDLAVTGGVRHLVVKVDLELPQDLKAGISPGLWDPLIGVDWRRNVTKKLWVNASFQGGGFGAGLDVDLSGRVAADWEFLPHFALDLGYDLLYFKQKIKDVQVGPYQRELTFSQTLYGPRFGVGITW